MGVNNPAFIQKNPFSLSKGMLVICEITHQLKQEQLLLEGERGKFGY